MLASLKVDSQNFGKSLRGLKWIVEQVDERVIANLTQKLGISEILAVILHNRDIKDVLDAEFFLDPKIRNYLPNPFELKDMDKAVARIVQAIQNNEKITIFGDYDVDGATSSALLKRFFRDIGITADIYIPNRIEEGYGPNVGAFESIISTGTTLIITVDCGSVSFDPIAYAEDRGVNVVVLDHHLSLETLPKAHAIVNPNRIDETFSFKTLAAVGVAYLTIIAIKSILSKNGYFDGKEEVNLLQYLDLVALGTVCDVMSLKGINRAFVAQGIKLINSRANIGLAALAEVVKLAPEAYSYHLGYVLGPRINAGGRVGEGRLGSILLSTPEYAEALEIANKLESLNEERRAIEAVTIEDALSYIEANKLFEKPIIIVKGEGWHQGILGILASRIKEKYNRPSAVISISGGVGKGSARSITGIDIGSMMSVARSQNLLIQGGGHAMAAGFTVAEDKIDAFYDFMCQKLANSDEMFEKAREVKIDAIVSVGTVNGKLVEELSASAPFGAGNPQPRLALLDVVLVSARVVGRTHVMAIVSDSKSDRVASHTLKCMLFKSIDTDIGQFLLSSIGKRINLCGMAQPHYQDRDKADFIIEDISVN
ncbi:MAG: single-stranded-DNA-specific exonuclease RecJ [Alphaproteobacteria bacterium]|nr:single-stranded-DNA-specific exonuclease RecJ [Candidatus Jidaibacter sp.]